MLQGLCVRWVHIHAQNLLLRGDPSCDPVAHTGDSKGSASFERSVLRRKEAFSKDPAEKDEPKPASLEEERRRTFFMRLHRLLRRVAFLRLREDQAETRPMYCRVNLAVPVLDRFINGEETRQDFRLNRDGHCYINRKLFASVILQAVCDHQGHFLDTYVGWPGSVHDARVLRYSPLYRQAAYPPPGPFILAIFFKALEVDHTFVPQVITARAVLHNICLGADDIMPPEDEVQDVMTEVEGESGLEAVSGAPWRDRLSAEVSALEEVNPNHNYICSCDMAVVGLVTLQTKDNPVELSEASQTP